MAWGSYNSTDYQTRNGKVINNQFISSGSYFGYGVAVAGHQNIYTAGNSFAGAKFSGTPSAACLHAVMPPDPMALTRSTYTSWGAFQRVTDASQLAFLICLMPSEYATEGKLRKRANPISFPVGTQGRLIDDRPFATFDSDDALNKVGSIKKDDVPFHYAGQVDARSLPVDENGFTEDEVEIVPPPSHLQTREAAKAEKRTVQ